MNAAVAKDTRYWLENDTKIRAVEQGVPTYEHFRQLVAGCHLRPLDKAELASLAKSQTGWTHTRSSDTVLNTSCIPAKPPELQVHLSPQKFYSQWQLLQKQNDLSETNRQWRLCELIFRQPPQLLRDLFDSGLGASLLPELLSVMAHAYLVSNFVDPPCISTTKDLSMRILSTIQCFSESDQFSMAVEFLSAAELQTVRKLFDQIERDQTDSVLHLLTSLRPLFRL
ncbi:Coiled-coil domain-containing protein [Paragonimus heterotremus]|uniref:Coiled-coil domain-containing protein n=1 Tax=Paragonimus heterotremus TaxID=100268 RepID=A0A8J4T6Y7_9TREM|nr:Coiled-coil domain-containing protein [Paragonimus heterotremus]